MNDIEVSRSYIERLGLVPHPEGGFYAVTHVDETTVSSALAKDSAARPVASVIYYLLGPEGLQAGQLEYKDKKVEVPKQHRSHAGYFHTNNSTTSHTWHSGRCVYTLVRMFDATAAKPVLEVRTVVLGSDLAAGEQMQLILPKGWWKRSETSSHCLISETVCPGWHPDDHRFMTRDDLEELLTLTVEDEKEGNQLFRDWSPHTLESETSIFS